MKSIKKIKQSSKAVAGTALLVGATLAGGASFALAQDSGSSGDLGDYPGHFVNEDGTISSTVVMGEDAKAIDVVAGAQIAGQLGNNAFSSETQTVDVSGSFGWSTETGQVLDTQNDNLYFSQTIDEVRQTLTEDQLEVLQTMEVLSGDQEQEVEQYLYIGNQEIDFGTPGDTSGEEDPFLYVDNPSGVENADLTQNNAEDNYLYRLQANFEDGVEFYDSGAGSENNYRNEDVYGEEITMFGMDFTIADASFQDDTKGQLILYGSSQEVSVDSGQSETVTIAGEEVTIEVVGVTGSNEAAVRINGDLEQYSENDEETIGGEDLRVDNIIQTNADNSQGVVQFAIGSERVVLEDGEPVVTGEDEEEVDGTQVVLSGTGVADDNQLSVEGDNDVELSSVEVAVGSQDSDDSYVRAGESFSGPVFSDVEFHFGGLNPDAGEGASDSVGEIDFSTDGDDTATVAFSDGDNSATIPFIYDNDLGNDGNQLAADNNDDIHVLEGAAVQEDEYIATDAGDFSHMWQVTSIDAETENAALSASDEATVELEDQVTGATVELDLDADNGPTDIYAAQEVIDGQSYYVHTNNVNSANANEVYLTYGDGAGYQDTGDETSVFTPVDTDSGSAVGFYKEVSVTDSSSATDDPTDDTDSATNDFEATFEVPSTESTDARTVSVKYDDSGTDLDDDADINLDGGTDTGYIQVGRLVYRADVSSGTLSFGLHDGSTGTNALDQTGTSGDVYDENAAVVVQPEDDSDNEEAYVHTPGVDTDDEELDAGGNDASIFYSGAGGYSGTTQTLESDDDMEVGYNFFGTHTMQDTEDQGSFTLHIPDGQSTAGAAFTAQDGELSASAGGSGSVETMMPTGWSNQYVALDSDSSISNAKQNRNMILVGGPSVNSLVGELVEANKTMAASEYTEGQGMLQMVEDAFTEGNDALVVAGYAGEDTRAAGEFLTNYEENSDALEGSTEVTVNTAEGTVVQ